MLELDELSLDLGCPADSLWGRNLQGRLQMVAESDLFGTLFHPTARGEMGMHGAHGQSCVVSSAAVGQIAVFYAALRFAELATSRLGWQREAHPHGRPTPPRPNCTCREGVDAISSLASSFWDPLLGKESLRQFSPCESEAGLARWAGFEDDVLEVERRPFAYDSHGAFGIGKRGAAIDHMGLHQHPTDPITLTSASSSVSRSPEAALLITDKVMIGTSLYLKQFIDRHLQGRRFDDDDIFHACELLKILRGCPTAPDPGEPCDEFAKWARPCRKVAPHASLTHPSQSDSSEQPRALYWTVWSYTRAPQLKLLYAHSKEAIARCSRGLVPQHPAESVILILEHRGHSDPVGPTAWKPRAVASWFNRLCAGLPGWELGIDWADDAPTPCVGRGVVVLEKEKERRGGKGDLGDGRG